MFSPIASRKSLPFLLVAGLLVPACSKMPAPFERKEKKVQSDQDAPFNPTNDYPAWAYDAPSYMKPVEELSPAASVREGDPLHYFTNQKLVQVRAPADYAAEDIPRVAVWWTDNNGFHWQKAGYFGRAQSFFPFEVEEDGDYGIRFVGPGQAPANETPAVPERVYHVDTTLPEGEVTIDPDQSQYEAGQKITISWRAADYHLIEAPVSIKMMTDFSAAEPRIVELQRGLADAGSITYEISPDAADHQVRFRVEACDRANNLGLGISPALQVVAPKPAGSSDDVAEAPLEASSVLPAGAAAEPAEEQATPAALTGTPAEEAAPPPPVSKAPGTRTPGPQGGPDAEEAVMSAVEVDLLGGSPAGAAPKARPAGAKAKSLDARRAEGTLFDASKPDRPAVKAAAELKKALASADTAESAPPPATKPPASRRFSMLPSDEEAMEKAAPEPEAAAPVETTTPPSRTEEPASKVEPVEPEADSSHELRMATALDVTRGNGLLVPMPATVEPEPPASTRLATIHPWRILGSMLSPPLQAVWSLPRGRLGYELNRLLDGRLLADNPVLRAVTEPGSVGSEFARTPADADEADGEPAP